MSESELERELHRRGQKLVRKLLQGHHDQRSPGQAAGPAEDASGVECSARREQDSHAETTSGTMQVVGLGCARRGHDGLHPLDAALNLLPERSLVDMRWKWQAEKGPLWPLEKGPPSFCQFVSP